MSRIRSKDTLIEIKVRKALFSKGFRYRLNYPLYGKPDIVFPSLKIAVFVNGCFWHMHGCKLSKVPSTRRDFWQTKLERNHVRDLDVEEKLKSLGWRVYRIWECEIENDLNKALYGLINMLSSSRGRGV